MTTLIRALAVLAVAVPAASGHAGDLNGSLGLTFSHVASGNHYVGLGGKATAGYAADWGALLDVGYLDTGWMRDDLGEDDFDFNIEERDDRAGPTALVRVGTATLGYGYHPAPEFTARLRGGYYEGRSWIRSDEIGDDRRFAHGVVAGLDAEYRPHPNVGVRWGVDVLFRVPDYSDQTRLRGDGHTDFFLASVGVVFGTGHADLRTQHARKRESRRQQNESAARQRQEKLQEAAAAAARQRDEMLAAKAAEAPPPELAPPPVAAVPAPPAAESIPPPPALTAGHPARLRPGAIVRTRATPEGDVVKEIAPGDRVVLKVMLRNATGAWWYLNAPSASGWALDTDLEPLAP